MNRMRIDLNSYAANDDGFRRKRIYLARKWNTNRVDLTLPLRMLLLFVRWMTLLWQPTERNSIQDLCREYIRWWNVAIQRQMCGNDSKTLTLTIKTIDTQDILILIYVSIWLRVQSSIYSMNRIHKSNRIYRNIFRLRWIEQPSGRDSLVNRQH